jgi:hypothetical protein
MYFFIISQCILVRMRNTSDKTCREIQNTLFVFSNFFQKIVPFMRKCGDCFTAGNATNENMAHAHCVRYNWLRLSNNSLSAAMWWHDSAAVSRCTCSACRAAVCRAGRHFCWASLCHCGSLLVTAISAGCQKCSDRPRAEQPRKFGLVPSNGQGFCLFQSVHPAFCSECYQGSLLKVKAEVAWNWPHLHLLPRLRMSGAISPFPGTPSCAQTQLTFILWSVWRHCRQLSNSASKLRFIDECWKGVDIERRGHHLEALRNITISCQVA